MEKKLRLMLVIVFVLLAVVTLFNAVLLDENIGGSARKSLIFRRDVDRLVVDVSKPVVNKIETGDVVSGASLVSSAEKEVLSRSQKDLFSLNVGSIATKKKISKIFSYDTKQVVNSKSSGDLVSQLKKEQVVFDIPKEAISGISVSGSVKIFSNKGLISLLVVFF